MKQQLQVEYVDIQVKDIVFETFIPFYECPSVFTHEEDGT
jgi:hypothetical protein